jgi:hypothetical protein
MQGRAWLIGLTQEQLLGHTSANRGSDFFSLYKYIYVYTLSIYMYYMLACRTCIYIDFPSLFPLFILKLFQSHFQKQFKSF